MEGTSSRLSFTYSEYFSHGILFIVCCTIFSLISVSACYTLIESGILVAAISWTGSSQLSMHFVMTMKKVKEGMDTAQTGEVVKDPQVEGVLLVLTAEEGREVAQTTEEARRRGAQTMAGEDAALIMAG